MTDQGGACLGACQFCKKLTMCDCAQAGDQKEESSEAAQGQATENQ